MTQPGLELTVGDTAPALTGTIAAATVGATAEVHLGRQDGTHVSRPAISLDDNSDGTSNWSLALEDGDLTIEGWYVVEVEVTYSGGKKQTFALDADGRPVTFNVRQQIA